MINLHWLGSIAHYLQAGATPATSSSSTTPGPDPADPRWWSLFVALLALVQPWGIALVKRFVRRGKLRIVPAGSITLMYDPSGPRLRVVGTMRVIERDHFVKHVQASIERCQDQSMHAFQWVYWRQIKILANQDEDDKETPASFMITVASPTKYNIEFTDRLTTARLIELAKEIGTGWNTLSSAPSPSSNGSPRTAEEIYSEYAVSTDYKQRLLDLDHLCYWEAGEYKLSLMVESEEPKRTVSETWRFSLSDADERALRGNAGDIIREACRLQPYFQYAQVTTDYL